MRLGSPLILVLLVACSPADPLPVRLPDAIAELTLCESDPTITPVEFPHASHVDPSVMGRDMTCADCHHDVRDDPTVPIGPRRPCVPC